jgi:hypothetical protein
MTDGLQNSLRETKTCQKLIPMIKLVKYRWTRRESLIDLLANAPDTNCRLHLRAVQRDVVLPQETSPDHMVEGDAQESGCGRVNLSRRGA